MALRWVLCPVVDTGAFRAPKIATLVDPSRGKPYKFSAAVGVADWCLALIRADDFSTVDAESDCVDLLGQDYEDSDGFLAQTPNSLGWAEDRVQALTFRLVLHGADVSDLGADTPLWQWVQRLGRQAMGDFNPRGTWVP